MSTYKEDNLKFLNGGEIKKKDEITIKPGLEQREYNIEKMNDALKDRADAKKSELAGANNYTQN